MEIWIRQCETAIPFLRTIRILDRVKVAIMKKELVIEWTHDPGTGEVPIRVEETGKGIFELLEEIRPIIESDGISYRFVERTIPGAVPALFFNGRQIEAILSEAASSQYVCAGRRCDPGPEMYFRLGEEGGRRILFVPEILIRKAVLLALEDE